MLTRSDCLEEFTQLKRISNDQSILDEVIASGNIDLGYEKMRGIGILPDISEEMLKWRDQMAGLPAVCLLNVYLIIAIRRGVDLPDNLVVFYSIWRKYTAQLCAKCNLKWIISAADTIVDYPERVEDRGYAVAAMLFGKTVKVYETEMRAKKARQMQIVDTERYELFDQYLNYAIKGGDLIGHMERRVLGIDEISYSTQILKEVFRRVLSYDTAFTRIR
jgi:hypothetical protein